MDYSKYIDAIQDNLALDKDRWFFKSDPRYNVVLEHVSHDLGIQYLECIKSEFSELYNENKDFLSRLAIDNDKYGKPIIFNVDDFAECSPTNLRYIYHCFLILEHVNECKINNIDFIEIGGGYGGLAYYIHAIAPLFSVNISSYSILDLGAAKDLQKRYLDIHGVELSSKINGGSFLISNYAFSELSENIRSYYSESVINKYTDYGFLAWNFIDVYPFKDNADITVCNERPLTARSNRFVYFKPKR
jgi:hypothetical protein